jgi:hypothetical protein
MSSSTDVFTQMSSDAAIENLNAVERNALGFQCTIKYCLAAAAATVRAVSVCMATGKVYSYHFLAITVLTGSTNISFADKVADVHAQSDQHLRHGPPGIPD